MSELTPIYTDAERSALEATPRLLEIDGRQISGGGLIRVLFNKRTNELLAHLNDLGLEASWPITPDSIKDTLMHPWGTAPKNTVFEAVGISDE